jgi:hypothetical protein
MEKRQVESTAAKSGKDWQRTPFANLVHHVPSGTYYARLRVKGKLIRDITKTDCLNWAAKLGAKASPTAFNHAVASLRALLEIGIEAGGRHDNPAGSSSAPASGQSTLSCRSRSRLEARPARPILAGIHLETSFKLPEESNV